MNYKTMGLRIRMLRKELNMTQEQLAEQAAVSASFLGHIERGTRIASLETLVAICTALNTDPNYLLAGSYIKRATPRIDSKHLQNEQERALAMLHTAYEILERSYSIKENNDLYLME